jgi:hypothetical protein
MRPVQSETERTTVSSRGVTAFLTDKRVAARDRKEKNTGGRTAARPDARMLHAFDSSTTRIALK